MDWGLSGGRARFWVSAVVAMVRGDGVGRVVVAGAVGGSGCDWAAVVGTAVPGTSRAVTTMKFNMVNSCAFIVPLLSVALSADVVWFGVEVMREPSLLVRCPRRVVYNCLGVNIVSTRKQAVLC